jgi:predicted lipid-binding transport protein (Tim44 family)
MRSLPIVVAALVLLPASLDARPGGGHSYRSSGSSYRSSGSSYRSSGSSYRSSGSSYRSSGSSYRSSSSSSYHSSSSSSYHSSGSSYRPGAPPRPLAPVVIASVGTAPTTTWHPGGPSAYRSVPAALSATFCTVSAYGKRQHVGLWVLGILVAIVTGLVVWGVRSGRRRRQSATPFTGARLVEAGASVARQLDAIQQSDPDFSVVLLEDFLYALYAEAHTARGQGQLARLAPYLTPETQRVLSSLGSSPVSTVVVGSMTFLSFRTNDQSRFHLEVEYESNYTEAAGGKSQSYYARERWQLARQRTARSRPPDRVRVFRCPNCDAPTDQISGRVCGYCGEVVTTGQFEWVVERIRLEQRETRAPMLTGTTEEEGTELPTMVDRAVFSSIEALAARDPQFSEEGLLARVRFIFESMQAAWSSLEWERARPFLSDRLHEAQSYWIIAYRASGLRNITERTQIRRIELVRASRDRWFDAITVRLFACGLDYTVRDADGAVVGGSKSRERAYSEYWTLIRSAQKTGPASATPNCPQCGAPLSINMTGRCTHCEAKINSGEFDWVLSRIEQDESYQG